jgi:hypothetical protein
MLKSEKATLVQRVSALDQQLLSTKQQLESAKNTEQQLQQQLATSQSQEAKAKAELAELETQTEGLLVEFDAEKDTLEKKIRELETKLEASKK